MDFRPINAAALAVLLTLIDTWLPGGRREGDEYVVRNPRRADQTPGSFKINVRTGAWADFATGDRGSDPISLLAFLRHEGDQAKAARALAAELGIDQPKAKPGGRIGCTLDQYAAAKQLPPSFLRSLGLEDTRYGSAPAVAIPYRDRDGNETARRFRTALDKSDPDRRFRWRKGAKPSLYGLWKLKPGPCITGVEGESDCHTLWCHGIEAVGIPGAAAWDEQRDAAHLEGFATIYVVIEPDEAGEALKRTLGKSAIRNRLKFVSLAPCKDVSALHLHLDDSDAFLRRWEEALARSVPWTAAEARTEQAGGEAAAAVTMPYGFFFKVGIPFAPPDSADTVDGWRSESIRWRALTTQAPSRSWTSGFGVRLPAAPISAGSAGRGAFAAHTVELSASRGKWPVAGCGAGHVAGRPR